MGNETQCCGIMKIKVYILIHRVCREDELEKKMENVDTENMRN